MGLKLNFNEYEIKARQLPGLIVISPLVIICYLWFPSLKTIGGILWGLVSTLGITYFISKLVRNAGKNLETRLVKKWGGLPTTIILRHSDSTIETATKQRYYNYIEKHIPGIKIPTKEEELKDRKATDDIYISAVKWLIGNTRDTKKYNLLFNDNVNYGFSRNLLGLKPFGILFSVISFIINIVCFNNQYTINQFNKVPINVYIAFGVSIVYMLIWCFFISEQWLKSYGYAYARTLLETCDRN